MTGARRPLEPGERAPDFVARGPDGTPARFYAHAGGRPTALLFGGADPPAATAGRDDVVCWRVTREGGPGRWADPEGRVAAGYGVAGDAPSAVVLDPNLRVVAVVTGDGLADRVAALLDAARHRDPPVPVTAQAPVLMLPAALPPEWCARLVDRWHAGAAETGVARAGGEEPDQSYKRRRDHTVTEPEFLRALSTEVGRRVLPEVRRVFGYPADRFEGFKIACYEGTAGGFFRPHRDNLSPATAHRVFALSLNLNDAYRGGELRFPEYGNQRYRPDAGAALVFSGSLLHEVCEVTEGRRFVLLSFLYRDSRTGSGP